MAHDGSPAERQVISWEQDRKNRARFGNNRFKSIPGITCLLIESVCFNDSLFLSGFQKTLDSLTCGDRASEPQKDCQRNREGKKEENGGHE